MGASLCILKGDETLIDVFAGTSIDGEQPWQRETMSVVHSCTKAAVSLSLLWLIDQGEVALHREVGDYWPEYRRRVRMQQPSACCLIIRRDCPPFAPS